MELGQISSITAILHELNETPTIHRIHSRILFLFFLVATSSSASPLIILQRHLRMPCTITTFHSFAVDLYTPTSTTLHGFRSSVRQKFSGLKRMKFRKEMAHGEYSNSSSLQSLSFKSSQRRRNLHYTTMNEQFGIHDPLLLKSSTQDFNTVIGDPSATEERHLSTSSGSFGSSSVSTTILLPPSLISFPRFEENVYKILPLPENRQLNKFEMEFRDILTNLTNCNERDLMSLRDPRMRKIRRGIAASANDPDVYRAFEVLFEDVYPLRFAGRRVYSMLNDYMLKSREEREVEVSMIVNSSGLNIHDIEMARLAFVSVASELNGDAFLTRNQLQQIDVLAHVAVNILHLDSIHVLIDRLELTRKSNDATNNQIRSHHHHYHLQEGEFLFSDLIIGLQHISKEMCVSDSCDPAAVMRHIMWELNNSPPQLSQQHENLNELSLQENQRRKFGKRYDEMLEQFMEWENFVPENSDGRRVMDVVKGCFVGARNPAIVEALRIVYTDYTTLRLAGGIIFKLVSGVMKARGQLKNL